MRYRSLLLAALLTLSPLSHAEEFLPGFDADEPVVTIRHGDDKTYYEYHVAGELKEIKVVPRSGSPYYLIPVLGSEKFIRTAESQLLVPKWILFRW
ncbi:MAG: DUF2782 domain-containing protein [Marinobacterium sp.]|nr:DUF2782 domain-containing protein [Marinobacterium sp.]